MRTLGVQHSGADVRLHAVFILAILPLFARVITQHNAALWRSYRRGMRIPARWICALQAKLAESGRLWSFWWNICWPLLNRDRGRGGLNRLRSDDRRSGGGWGLGLGVGLLVALELLSAVIWSPSSTVLLLLPLLLLRRNKAVVHPICHTHILESRLARQETTRRDHPHGSSHLGHQRHLVHHHLLKYQRVCHLSGHSCIHVESRNHSVLELRRHGDLRLVLLLGESGAARSDSLKETSTWVSALTVTAIAEHCTRTGGKVGAT